MTEGAVDAGDVESVDVAVDDDDDVAVDIDTDTDIEEADDTAGDVEGAEDSVGEGEEGEEAVQGEDVMTAAVGRVEAGMVVRMVAVVVAGNAQKVAVGVTGWLDMRSVVVVVVGMNTY